MILNWILLLMIAAFSYVLGSMSTLVLASNFVFRTSLSRLGKGNVFISNFRRLYGIKGAILLLLVEAVKDALPIIVGGLLMSITEHADVGRMFAAFCMVLGRVFPLFYNFKGSHGSFCLVAAGFAAGTSIGIVVLISEIAVAWLSRYVALGTLVGAVMLVIVSVLMLDNNTIMWLAVFTSALIIIRHIPSISRMSNGQEEKLSYEKDISYKFDERF